MNSTSTFRPRSIESVRALALFAFCASILYASAASIAHADGSGWHTQAQADRGRVAYAPTQTELNAADIAETHWLMYNKGYSGERYSSLRQIALHEAVCAADSEDSAYVIQQENAAPVTVTESPDHPAEQSTGEIRKSPNEGSESHSSGATSTEDQRQTPTRNDGKG